MSEWFRDPFINFERVQREIDELFRDVLTPPRTSTGGVGFTPHVDVAYQENPSQLVVRADLAGVAIEDIQLELVDKKLVIAGKRVLPSLSVARYQRFEIPQGYFKRVLDLGFQVQADGVQAVYQDGVLTVLLPVSDGQKVETQAKINVNVRDDE